MTISGIPSWGRIGLGLSVPTVATGLGAGIMAAYRDDNIIESASVVSAGTGLMLAGLGIAAKLGMFGEIKCEPVSPTMHVLAPAFYQLIGTSIGYSGAKFFMDTAISTAPLANAVLGFPITLGVMFCGKLLLDYYDQNQNIQNGNLKPHSL